MKEIILEKAKLSISRISFGTAQMHHISILSQRQRLILSAFDAGITHFDTSPYYGFGIAERSLAVLAGESGKATIATKVGMYAPGGHSQLPSTVFFRKLGGKLFINFSRPVVDFSISIAQKSLENSLRALKRDYIDILFIHEPIPRLILTDEWLAWIEKSRNIVRAFGLAGKRENIDWFRTKHPTFANIFQTKYSEKIQPDYADLTFGHFSNTQHMLGRSEDRVKKYAILNPNTSILFFSKKISRINAISKAFN